MNLYAYCSNNPINWIDPWGWKKDKQEEEPDEIWIPTTIVDDTWLRAPEKINKKFLLEDSSIDFLIDLLITIIAAIEPTPVGETAIAGRILGYTKHGINQAISRGGKGVSVKAILEAVRNPIKVTRQIGGRTKYVGKQATVIINKLGKIISTWGQPR